MNVIYCNSQVQLSVHPPLCDEGLNLLPNFQKVGEGGGGLTDLNFERRVTGKEGGNFFQGWMQYLQKNKLKSEIFNDKKSL